ncbi:MAG: zinc ribbon domain-containing protein [Chitinispirillaceae bacterium]|nr:zinc ribbon domain-containing protein [Chitinispirillaceae bacterium]
MPIYEYSCRDCGAEFEELVSLAAKENPACPSCRSERTERKISTFSAGGASSCGPSGFS